MVEVEALHTATEHGGDAPATRRAPRPPAADSGPGDRACRGRACRPLRGGTARRRWNPRLLPDDLAPGDRGRRAARRLATCACTASRGAGDPDFAVAYDRLWTEFGARGEMERAAVIDERLAWDPARPVAASARSPTSCSCSGAAAPIAALRDHTAVVRLDARGRPRPGPVVVHLSHALVEPPQRGSGLAGWLRALPLQAARRCAAAAGAAPDAPVVLVAEMEPPDPAEPAAGSAAPLLRARRLPEASIRRRHPTPSPTSGRLGRWPATRREALSPGAGAAAGRPRGRGRRCPRPRSPRWSTRSTPSTACTCRRRPSTRCAHDSGALDRSPRDASGCYLPRRDHGLSRSRLRRADRRSRDADAEVPARGRRTRGARGRARRSAGADRRARRLLRVHTRRLRRRRARPASRVPSRRARSSLVAALLPSVLLTNGGALAAASRALDDGVAAALASGFHHSHADHGEGFCTFNGLVVAAEALRAASRVRARRRARPRPPLRKRHGVALRDAPVALQLLDLRQRLLAEHAVPGRREPGATRTARTTSPSRSRTGAAAPRCSRRSSAAWRRCSPSAGRTSCSTRPAPTRTARIPYSPLDLDLDDLRERDRFVFAVDASARGSRSHGCSRAATRPTCRGSWRSTSVRSTPLQTSYG